MSFGGLFGAVFSPLVSATVDAAQGHTGQALQTASFSGLPYAKHALMGNSSNPDTSANDELGQLYRDEWADYLQRYAPLENQQVGLMSDSANALERQQAVSAVGGQYAGGKPLKELQRQALGYGINLSPQQIQSFKQKANTQQGLDTVNAYNKTSVAQTDRAFGGLGSPYQPGASISKPATLVPGG